MLLTQIKAQHDPLLGQGSIQISQTLGGKNCTFKEQTARIVRLHGLRHARGWKRSCVVTLNFFCRSAQLAVVNQNIFQLSSPVELGFMKYLIFGLICCHIFDRFGRLMSSLVNALCILHFPLPIFLHLVFFPSGDLFASNSAASPTRHHEHRRCQQGRVFYFCLRTNIWDM